MANLSGFIGSWQEVTKEGFDDMAKALGLPEDKIEMYKAARTAISYAQEGDTWIIDVGLVGAPTKRNFRFKLGESYKSADIDGTPMQSLVNADSNGFVEEHTYEDGKMKGGVMQVQRWLEGDSMKVKTTMCGHSILSTYQKA